MISATAGVKNPSLCIVTKMLPRLVVADEAGQSVALALQVIVSCTTKLPLELILPFVAAKLTVVPTGIEFPFRSVTVTVKVYGEPFWPVFGVIIRQGGNTMPTPPLMVLSASELENTITWKDDLIKELQSKLQTNPSKDETEKIPASPNSK